MIPNIQKTAIISIQEMPKSRRLAMIAMEMVQRHGIPSSAADRLILDSTFHGPYPGYFSVHRAFGLQRILKKYRRSHNQLLRQQNGISVEIPRLQKTQSPRAQPKHETATYCLTGTSWIRNKEGNDYGSMQGIAQAETATPRRFDRL